MKIDIGYLINLLFALLLLFLIIPFWLIFYFIVKASSGSFFFKQKRSGKDKKIFTIYKIRTMVKNAEELKKNYLHLNEADGPVFKIKNDPRFTNIGKFLSRTGLDETPQLINVIKGEMRIVGPRPLPIDESLKIPSLYKARFSVLPGITSYWIIMGGHRLKFKEWMELDVNYAKNKKLSNELFIAALTAFIMSKLLIKESLRNFNKSFLSVYN